MSQVLETELDDTQVAAKIGDFISSNYKADMNEIAQIEENCINFINDQLLNVKRDWNFILNEYTEGEMHLILSAVYAKRYRIALSLRSIKVKIISYIMYSTVYVYT